MKALEEYERELRRRFRPAYASPREVKRLKADLHADGFTYLKCQRGCGRVVLFKCGQRLEGGGLILVPAEECACAAK